MNESNYSTNEFSDSIKKYGFTLSASILQWAKILEEKEVFINFEEIDNYYIDNWKIIILSTEDLKRKTKVIRFQLDNKNYVYFLIEKDWKYVQWYNPYSKNIKWESKEWNNWTWKSLLNSYIANWNQSFDSEWGAKQYYKNISNGEFSILVSETESSEWLLNVLKSTKNEIWNTLD